MFWECRRREDLCSASTEEERIYIQRVLKRICVLNPVSKIVCVFHCLDHLYLLSCACPELFVSCVQYFWLYVNKDGKFFIFREKF